VDVKEQGLGLGEKDVPEFYFLSTEHTDIRAASKIGRKMKMGSTGVQ